MTAARGTGANEHQGRSGASPEPPQGNGGSDQREDGQLVLLQTHRQCPISAAPLAAGRSWGRQADAVVVPSCSVAISPAKHTHSNLPDPPAEGSKAGRKEGPIPSKVSGRDGRRTPLPATASTCKVAR